MNLSSTQEPPDDEANQDDDKQDKKPEDHRICYSDCMALCRAAAGLERLAKARRAAILRCDVVCADLEA